MALKKSAVIIGAGIGGIATSVYLSRNGYNVNVYEKNSAPGRPVRSADPRWSQVRPGSHNAYDAGHLSRDISITWNTSF